MANLIANAGNKSNAESSLFANSEQIEKRIVNKQADIVKKMTSGNANVVAKRVTKEIVEEITKETSKEAAKKITKAAVKESSKTVAKETTKQGSKVVAMETAKAVATATTTTGSTIIGATGGAAFGTVVTPVIGTGIGMAIGKEVGRSTGASTDFALSHADAVIMQRNAIMKNFMITSLAEEGQNQETESIGKRVQIVLMQELKKIGSTIRFQAQYTAKILLPAAVPLLLLTIIVLMMFMSMIIIIASYLSTYSGSYSMDNYYCQYEEPWSSFPYGEETIKTSGCGPTTFAMVVSTITDTQMNPAEAAVYFEESGYCLVSADGNTATTWSAFESGITPYGLSSSGCGTNLKKGLEIIANGGMVVCSVGNSANGGEGNALFNGDGHFIAIRGISESGNLLILDPASRKNTEQEWDAETVQEILKQCWQIYPNSESEN